MNDIENRIKKLYLAKEIEDNALNLFEILERHFGYKFMLVIGTDRTFQTIVPKDHETAMMYLQSIQERIERVYQNGLDKNL